MTLEWKTLTREQLATLNKEYQFLKEWTTVRDFCNHVYGEGKAVKMEVSTYGAYNDEGGTDYYIEDITAYDANGEELEFDLTLPLWQHIIHGPECGFSPIDDEEDALGALRNYGWYGDDNKIKKANGWVEWDDLPREDATYDLTVEPVISFPVVASPIAVVDI